MSHSILSRFMGAEELELSAAAEDQVEAIVEETVRAEIAEATVEMQEVAADVQELTDNFEELEEDFEELEETVDGLEAHLASGNFNGPAFAHMFNRANTLSVKLGGKGVDNRMGAESLTDAATAQVAARDGLESFTDTVKKYGQTAIAFIKNIFNAIINFFVGLVNKAAALKRRQEQLVKRVNATEKLKEEITLGGWNAWIDYEKSVLHRPDLAKDIDSKLQALSAAVKDSDSINLGTFKSAYNGIVAAVKAAATSKKEGGTEGKKEVLGQVNGIRIQVSYFGGDIKDAKEAVKAARALKVYIGKAPEAKALTTGKVKAKADKSALSAALSSAGKAIDGLKATKAAKAMDASIRDTVVGNLNKLKGDDAEKAAEVKDNVSIVKATFSSLASAIRVINAAEAAAIDAQLSGVAAHL